MGVVSGKIFDAGYGRMIIRLGSALFIFSLFMLSLTKQGQFYQIFLSQGLGMGFGVGLLFVPTTATVSVHFNDRPHRVLAMGLALSGSSFGALLFPIMINKLLPTLGFASTVRDTAYLDLGLLILGNFCVRVVPHKKAPPPDVKAFLRDVPYVIFLLGGSIGLLGLYFPVLYMQLFTIDKRINSNLAFYTVSIINGMGIPARVITGSFAEQAGLWNFVVIMNVVSAVGCWAILTIDTTAALISFCIIYGFALGATLSLSLSLAGSLAKDPQEVGARLGIALAAFGPFLLVSSPIQGALLGSQFDWTSAIVFSAASTTLSSIILAGGRFYVARQRGAWRV